MLDLLVDGNITLRVCIVKQLLFSRVCVCGIDVAEFAQTVSRAVLQYVDDTTCTNVLTTSTFVTTERELGIELYREVLRYLYIGLEVDIGTTNARTKDDTLVLTLCQ